jgi:hypothetical protein
MRTVERGFDPGASTTKRGEFLAAPIVRLAGAFFNSALWLADIASASAAVDDELQRSRVYRSALPPSWGPLFLVKNGLRQLRQHDDGVSDVFDRLHEEVRVALSVLCLVDGCARGPREPLNHAVQSPALFQLWRELVRFLVDANGQH